MRGRKRLLRRLQDLQVIHLAESLPERLQEILRLQVDRESGKREYRLRPDMVKQASDLLAEYWMIDHEVTYEQLTEE